MADIQIVVSRNRGVALVSGLSEAGCRWIRRSLVSGCTQPVTISVEGVRDVEAEIAKDRLEVVVR